MTKTITLDWLEKENACADAIEWASSRLNGGKPLAECVEAMERADERASRQRIPGAFDIAFLSGRADITELLLVRHGQQEINDGMSVGEFTDPPLSALGESQARLVGMRIADPGKTLTDQIAALGREWSTGNFFFIHFKYTDSTGEDGNFAAKVARIEELDTAVPGIMKLNPDVFIVTGDHSTPSLLRSHSWQPVPTLIVSGSCRTDGAKSFGESECARGGLGHFLAKDLLPLALAHAGRLAKYGA